ncbi:calcium-translocating P-type ATPase, SERCA-type [Candidatus Micrarchaeota archaeon CG1_02_60_51]|nr:MAG: calcium-translocating P-type ATPase, SERCA-type [Candidatus Micrarchaeota archaeon CG1_02_60_51]
MDGWHHAQTAAKVLKEQESGANGLTEEEASRRLEKHGKNALKEAPRESPLTMFLGQFKDFMILLLLAAAAVSAALGETIDAAAIVAIVILNAIIGFTQEYRADKAIRALKALAAPKARVIRDGSEKHIDASEIVPGDVILIEEGDRAPADCRLLETVEFSIDEALLTGESKPSRKDADAALNADAPIAERRNMAYAGTVAVRGRAKAVVVATGMQTEMGKIAGLVQATKAEDTPLQQQLEALGKFLGTAALVICGIVFLVGLWRGFPPLEMFMTAVSLAVAAIPEGLPAVVTITLAIGVQRMASRNAIIRKLPAVETLGAATAICSDKTGTLTKNEMTVREIWLAGGRHCRVTGEGYEATHGEIEGVAKNDEQLGILLETACLCNNASLIFDDKKKKASVAGDPTEGCLLVAAEKGGLDYEELREKYAFALEVPFSSERRMMTVVRQHGKGYRVYSKGAPEAMLEKCTHALEGGKRVRLGEEEKKRILEANGGMARKALRVLAFAYRDAAAKPTATDAETELTFTGLAGMMDPPRPEAKQAVELCKQAGIRVVMITGDNPETAAAIGRELGLLSEGSRIMTGRELDEIKDLAQVAGSVAIYARVSPEHKLRIVDALKENGEIVAMTGDGVNDAPAIKRADIGIAMGITGTDVTKEAGSMIITDDNFASIVAAIEEGRTIYANIVKAVTYLVSCNIGEILTIFTAVAVGLPSPLTALQILWMNLATDAAPALALAMEPAEKGVMRQKPRNPKKPILGMHNAARIALVGAWVAAGTLAVYWLSLPKGAAVAETMAFTTIIFFQLFYALDCRSERPLHEVGFMSNKWMLAAVLGGVALQLVIVYTPFAEILFKTAELGFADLALATLTAASLPIALQIGKMVKK